MFLRSISAAAHISGRDRTLSLNGQCRSLSVQIRQHNSSSAQRPNSPQARFDVGKYASNHVASRRFEGNQEE